MPLYDLPSKITSIFGKFLGHYVVFIVKVFLSTEVEFKGLENIPKNEKYFVFSGIGNHKTFIKMLSNYGLDIIENIEFPDHYNYKNDDLEKIISKAKKLNSKILTTKKDYLRLNKKYLEEIKFIEVELKIIDENKIIESIL